MSTQAQIAANQANAQLSTGPKSEAGRAAAARNNFRHGLSTSSEFWVLPSERQTDYLDDRKLALYLRYQTTHERAFHKALNDLLKLRAEKRKAEIGFERQERARATETRRQEHHEMKKERHKWEILLAEVKVEGQQLRDLNHDIEESERLLAEIDRK